MKNVKTCDKYFSSSTEQRVRQNVAKRRGGYYDPPPEVPARVPINIKAVDGAPPRQDGETNQRQT
jgi:hypothetical protein